MPKKKQSAPAADADLDPALAAALAAAVGKKFTAPGPLPEGEYPVRGLLILRLDAVVTKGAAQTARPCVRFDPVRAVAAALLMAGVEFPRAATLAAKAFVAAGLDEASPKEMGYRDIVAGVAEREKEKLAADLPPRDVDGPTKVAGTVTFVSFGDAAPGPQNA